MCGANDCKRNHNRPGSGQEYLKKIAEGCISNQIKTREWRFALPVTHERVNM
jgi:hypothetical protein